MVTCAVTNCKNSSGNISKNKDGITFHRFPSDSDRRRQWELAVNRGEWKSTTSSTVCSQHFDPKDFYLTEGGLRRLNFKALPVINISVCQEPQQTISSQEPVDINPNDTEVVILLKYKVKRLEVIAETRKRRLNSMWQSKKRMRRKITRLKNIIRHLILFKKDKANNENRCR